MTARWAPAAARLHPAFTLVEVLVVMGIISVLVSLLLPALSRGRQQARRVTCLSNQRQIALAMHAFADDNHGRFPVAYHSDPVRGAFVTWDTITYADDPGKAEPGLIWQYTHGGRVQQCPSYEGPSMTSGDPFTGYNYNTTYIGRGEHEGPYRGMTKTPAAVSDVRFPSRTALVGDGGWSAGANKFMRAPLDGGVAEFTVHAGAQAYRHGEQTNVAYADGHGQSTGRRFRRPDAQPFAESLLDWPHNGFLSQDDRAYAHR